VQFFRTIFLFLIFALFALRAIAASVTGKVTDEKGAPVPFVTVYIEGTTNGTTTNSEGNYRIELPDGFHTIVFRYVGYKTEIRPVTVSNETKLDIILKRVVFQLGEAQIDGNEDPAYRIMRLARSRRKFYRNQVREYSCKVYVKGVNHVKNLPKRILGQSLDISGLDETRSGIVYLSESLSELHFKAPDKTKERVIASKVSGNSQGFTWNNATSINFNFYDRSYNLEGLSDRNLVSPLSPSANMYYRYIYRGFYVEDSIIVNKIELKPRVKGVPLFQGHIFIQENTWRIHGADVFLTKNAGIDFVDTVRLKVDFIPLTKDLWMKGNLSFELAFNVKLFKVKGWGAFTSVFSDYSIREYIRDTTFLDRYADIEEPTEDEKEKDADFAKQKKGTTGGNATQFNFKNWSKGAIIKVESEANEKDSAFWEKIRTVPLTALERTDYELKDSIETVKESVVYKDSIDKKNNKFVLRNLLFGYTYRNSVKDFSIDFQTPLTALGYNTVEGYLIDYRVGFFKRNKKKGSSLSIDWNNRYGFASKRYYSKGSAHYRFNTMNRMSVRAEGGHYLQQFQQNSISPVINSMYTIFLEQNFMKLQEHSYGKAGWGMEVTNGLRVNSSLYFGQRNTLQNAADLGRTFIDNERATFSLNQPGNGSVGFNDPVFGSNRAFVWKVSFDYRPGQKYMERPNRKINLGTPWPKFRFSYEKGFKGVVGSNSDYDLLKLSVSDDHSFGMVGSFEWRVEGGVFANNNFVPFMNWVHFNTSEVHVMNSSLGSFRALPYYAASTDHFYLQAHAEQHFHGFILNKIPLLKKLKWQMVGGAHYLYQPAYGNYWEITAGIENIFKIIRFDVVFPFRQADMQQVAFRFQLGI